MPSDKFYHTKKWERIRRAVLARDKYICQFAKRYGKTREASVVHHIFPREEFPELQWKSWNLVAVSSAAHNIMHDRETHALTRYGEELMRETAAKQGIKLQEQRTTLVIGNPGAGKTTFVKNHMRRGIVYDLDAIAGAFRLKGPKEENFKPARWLANSLLPGFVEHAKKYVPEVWIIRTAPRYEELVDINPDRLVVLYGNYNNAAIPADRRRDIAQRIKSAVEYARNNGVEVEEHET